MSDSRKYWSEQEQDIKEEALNRAKMLVKDKLESLERENESLYDERRFQAACSAMQGLLTTTTIKPANKEMIKNAVKLADALLQELNATSKSKL